MQRVKIEEIRKDLWFRKNYSPVKLREDEQVNLDDVQAVFDDIEVCCCFFYLLINLYRENLFFANVCVCPFFHIHTHR
jgi:hypothetical protein